MAEVAFDMIVETQRLRDAGLPHEQAEAVTLAIHAGVTGGVATKTDVEALRGDVSRDMEALSGTTSGGWTPGSTRSPTGSPFGWGS